MRKRKVEERALELWADTPLSLSALLNNDEGFAEKYKKLKEKRWNIEQVKEADKINFRPKKAQHKGEREVFSVVNWKNGKRRQSHFLILAIQLSLYICISKRPAI